jgi:hypothetical protein
VLFACSRFAAAEKSPQAGIEGELVDSAA